VKFAPPIHDEIRAHLVRLGLEKCPICEAGILGIAEKPVLVFSGGAPWPVPSLGGKPDPDAMVDYMARVECQMCGYNMLFNVERFRDGDTRMFQQV
jgi:hypothetical protein